MNEGSHCRAAMDLTVKLAQLRVKVLVSFGIVQYFSRVSALSTTAQQPSPIQVWDGVLSPQDQCKILHGYASKNGLGHSCFSRPLKKRDGRNIIELTLDSILAQIENNPPGVIREEKHYVEYWSRQEWRHIEAHADVDENLARQHDQRDSTTLIPGIHKMYPSTYHDKAGGYRYPINGHVLYLQVGTQVKGPTCVFPGRSSGGELLSSNEKIRDRNPVEDASASLQHEKDIKLVTIPPVAGRLLRFDGADLHAVPRPHDIWMLPFISGGTEFEPESVWARSVILFNVWPGDEDPPLDIPLDLDDSTDFRAEDGNPLCNDFNTWKKVPITQPENCSHSQDENNFLKVWLLGNERRRDHRMRTVPLLPPLEGGRKVVKKALAEDTKVTELWLRQQ